MMFLYLQRSCVALQAVVEWLYLRQVRRSHRRQLIATGRRHIDRLRLSSMTRSSSLLTASPESTPLSDDSLIERQLRTVLEDELPSKLREPRRSSFLLSSVILLLAILVAILCTPCVRYAKQLGRRSLFIAEPMIDYTNIYHTRCLIPRIKPPTIKESPESAYRLAETLCRSCQEQSEILESLKPIGFLSNLTEATVTWHLKNRLPLFLIDDSVSTWPIASMTHVQNWTEYYEKEEDRVCMFRSSLPEVANPSQFLEGVIDAPVDSWYAQWENCGASSKKQFRRLVRRPLQVPASVELSRPIWTMLSAGSPTTDLQIDPLADSQIVVQVCGSSRFELVPGDCRRCDRLAGKPDGPQLRHHRHHHHHHHQCSSSSSSICSFGRISAVLRPNHVVIASRKLWDFHYQPDNDLTDGQIEREVDNNNINKKMKNKKKEKRKAEINPLDTDEANKLANNPLLRPIGSPGQRVVATTDSSAVYKGLKVENGVGAVEEEENGRERKPEVGQEIGEQSIMIIGPRTGRSFDTKLNVAIAFGAVHP